MTSKMSQLSAAEVAATDSRQYLTYSTHWRRIRKEISYRINNNGHVADRPLNLDYLSGAGSFAIDHGAAACGGSKAPRPGAHVPLLLRPGGVGSGGNARLFRAAGILDADNMQ